MNLSVICLQLSIFSFPLPLPLPLFSSLSLSLSLSFASRFHIYPSSLHFWIFHIFLFFVFFTSYFLSRISGPGAKARRRRQETSDASLDRFFSPPPPPPPPASPPAFAPLFASSLTVDGADLEAIKWPSDGIHQRVSNDRLNPPFSQRK